MKRVPSATLEEYLEAIYKLSLRGDVRASQIAESLGVSAPTVTAGLRRLEAAGLVTRPEGKVALTDRGVSESVAIVRRHRIAERFLVDALGLGLDVAHEEACRLEHALSDTVLEALERYLDNPESCPHGHPIPKRDGRVDVEHGMPLCDLATGTRAVVVSVPEEDVLAYMGELGIRPGMGIVVEAAAPFEGPLLIEVEGRRAALDRGIACLVTVRPEP